MKKLATNRAFWTMDEVKLLYKYYNIYNHNANKTARMACNLLARSVGAIKSKLYCDKDRGINQHLIIYSNLK